MGVGVVWVMLRLSKDSGSQQVEKMQGTVKIVDMSYSEVAIAPTQSPAFNFSPFTHL